MSFATPAAPTPKRAAFDLPKSSSNTVSNMRKIFTPISSNIVKKETETNNSNSLIRVGVRVRPLSEKEQTHETNCVLVNRQLGQIVVRDERLPVIKPHKFDCDFVITDQMSKDDSKNYQVLVETLINKIKKNNHLS